ncbi:MAG: vWA domain-containing protein [Patescibacteria group bacterium]|nr:vWA domain-containing protein [Patescibacteria group bacterium]
MFSILKPTARPRRRTTDVGRRRGTVRVLFMILFPVILAFTALAIDTGMIVDHRTKMQNAVDAAALAAAGQIVAVVDAAGQDGSGEVDINSLALESARAMAAEVAARNGVYVDPNLDVRFGRSVYDEATDAWHVQRDAAPSNVVHVSARRDSTNPGQTDENTPDGRPLQLPFASAIGQGTQEIRVSATAFIESRDIVVVMDFSGSMNYDSRYMEYPLVRLGKLAIDENKWDIYDALDRPAEGTLPWEPENVTIQGVPPSSSSVPQITVTLEHWGGNYEKVSITSTKDLSNVVIYFSSGQWYKFESNNDSRVLAGGIGKTTGTFGSPWTGQIQRVYVKSGTNSSSDGPGFGERFNLDNNSLAARLGLNAVPYPAGWSGSWVSFINDTRNNSELTRASYGLNYRCKFGGKTLVEYVLKNTRSYAQNPDLHKTPHYPFHAVKNGCTLLLGFLESLDFGDAVGLVSYDGGSTGSRPASEGHRYEVTLAAAQALDGVGVDLASEPISKSYAELNKIQRHRQAAHYLPFTNIAGGLTRANTMLNDHARHGSRKTILLMTDGVANCYPTGLSMPAGFTWAQHTTNYDGQGGVYSTSDTSKAMAFYALVQAVKDGCTVHTMSVGTDADRNLMKAMAFAGGGIHIDVPGGSTIAAMEDQLLAAFSRIAAKVPPPRLIDPTE